MILIASPQKDLQERLSEIAPVLYYQTYSEQHSNAEAAIENFKKIGQLLGKEEQASNKLAAMDERIVALKAELDKAYPGDKPKVTSFRFASTTSVFILVITRFHNMRLSSLALKMRWSFLRASGVSVKSV